MFSKLFDSPDDKKITSLNLQIPKRQPPSTSLVGQVDPKLLEVAVPEITRRMQQMLDAGKRPAALYLAVVNGGQQIVSIKTQNPDRNHLLIFTSGFAVVDYLRVTGIAGGIHEFTLASLPTYLEQWRRMTIDSFVLDRCPRCPVFTSTSISDGLTEQQFLAAWAIHRATRSFQAERLIRGYLSPQENSMEPEAVRASPRQRRQYLETLRDHIDYSVPFVHWLIALNTVGEGEDEARLAAIQRLEEFGPDFQNKVPQLGTSEDSVKKLATCHTEAMLGLLATYGMLKPELQESVRIVEKNA